MLVVSRTMLIVTTTIIALVGFLYLTTHILVPFLIAATLAYFTAPLVKKLQSLKLSRPIAVSIILLGLIIILILFSLTLIPLFYRQIMWVVNSVINHKNDLTTMTTSFVERYHFSPTIISAFKASFNDISSNILTFFGNFITGLFQSGMTAINIVTTIFITPIVLYYFLLDWPKIVTTIDSLIPRRMHKRYHEIKKDVDLTLSNYIRGQTLVCVIMGCYYTISLTIVGSESGLALGLISGILTFIPYAGCLFSVFLSSFIIAVQYGELSRILIVIGIYCIGQFTEGNFIVPKIIGSKLHLHPVWIMFGLLAGGALLGFVGVLIALPLTAIIAVFIKYLLHDYKKSLIYSA